MYVYLEGGPLLRPAMKAFLLRAVNPSRQQTVDLNVVPCGSGDDAIRKCSRDSDALLLIDSEGPLSTEVVGRISQRIGANNRAFFMVQLMEAWFLADRPTLETYYGSGFIPGRLPANPNIENIPKSDVERGLRDATRRCRKGAYNKTTHATALLNRLTPPPSTLPAPTSSCSSTSSDPDLHLDAIVDAPHAATLKSPILAR